MRGQLVVKNVGHIEKGMGQRGNEVLTGRS